MNKNLDTFAMLQELILQDQFELLIPKEKNEKLKLVYLMNDAVESFLVFCGARMTGTYRADYEGELEASLTKEKEEYVLVVRQGNSVVTIFFKELKLEAHLYDYGHTAHFWVPGYEYLRQMEYRIAILRDKKEYLGEEYCTPMERKLAELAAFPPINYCCYPAVPEKYIVPQSEPWVPSDEAISVMCQFAEMAEDKGLFRMLGFYRRYPYRMIAKKIAGMLCSRSHAVVVDLIADTIAEEAASYTDRSFVEDANRRMKQLYQKAGEQQKIFKAKGIRADIVKEEPFTTAQDDLNLHVYLMIWNSRGRKRTVKIKEIE